MSVTLMYSGGLDSFVAYHYGLSKGLDVIPVFVDLGQPYAANEWQAIIRSDVPVIRLDVPVMRAKRYVGMAEHIVPGRNLLLALLGAMFGEANELNREVWVCALSTETHDFAKERDKSVRFYDDTTALLTYVFNITRETTAVTSPFTGLSKRQVVRLGLDLGLTPEQLSVTSSCYAGAHLPCGECGTCFKRWVAMSLNGIHETHQTNPWQSDYAAQELKNCADAILRQDFSHYHRERAYDTMEAIDLVMP